MKRVFLIFAALSTTSLMACSSGGATNSTGTGTGTGTGGSGCTPGSGVICVQAVTFNPVDLTISKGGSATWTEVAGAHNIVFDPPFAGGVSNIGDFSDGSVTRTFSGSGTFPYHCTIHGGVGTGMHGNVIVQ